MPTYASIIAADGDENITVAGTAATLTLPAQFSTSGGLGGRAIAECRDAAILFTLNGTAPTDIDGSTGHRLGIGDVLILDTKQEMQNLKMIRETSVSGAVFVTYQTRVT